jgi:hypothetical protein
MNLAIKTKFYKFHQECLDEEKKIEDVVQQRRENQEKQGMDNLLHKGKMSAFLAAEQGSNQTAIGENKFSVQFTDNMKKKVYPANEILATNNKKKAYDEDGDNDNDKY